MERITLLLLCLCMSISYQSFSQGDIRLPDGKPLSELDAPYVSVFPCMSLRAGLPFRIQIEYRERLRPLSQNEFLYDQNGQVLFESKTEILNFMYQQGYRLVQAITEPDGEIKYYLMERSES